MNRQREEDPWELQKSLYDIRKAGKLKKQEKKQRTLLKPHPWLTRTRRES
jgi:hypothetical protein